MRGDFQRNASMMPTKSSPLVKRSGLSPTRVEPFRDSLYRAMAVLVTASPCALAIASDRIHVMLADDRGDLLAKGFAMTTIARAVPFRQNKTRCAFGAHTFKQSEYLPSLQAKQ